MEVELFRLRQIEPARLAAARARYIDLVQRALPAADVREVGSTALGDVIGKQDIDILARVADEAALRGACQALDMIFARDTQQMANARYQAYVLSHEPQVSLQVTVTGCRHDVFMPFLDALRADRQLLDAYQQLKRDWDGRPMQAYRKAKARFIRRVLRNGGTRTD